VSKGSEAGIALAVIVGQVTTLMKSKKEAKDLIIAMIVELEKLLSRMESKP